MKATEKLIQAFGVTLEITGTEVSKGAAKVMLHDLAAYPEEHVLGALRRCCRELKGKLTLADILQRVDDGRPGPEEAWSMIPKDEASSVVWSTEMREAYSAAQPLIADGELVPARMAFLEKYRVLVQRARDERKPIEWEFSPGTDKDLRELSLLDAAEKGLLTVEAVRGLLPYHRADEGVNARLLAIASNAVKLLTA